MPTYVEASDLIERFDERDIQQLVVDDNSDWSVVDVTNNARVDTALDDAEGEVIAALRKGGRYVAEDLAALTGVDLKRLQRIICEIAMCHLYRRRPSFSKESFEQYRIIREDNLKDLQNGNSVMNQDDTKNETSGTVAAEGPSLQEWLNLDLWRDRSKYFPKRRP